ncbi:MAG: ABC transporter permease [Alphaproteobacteria bacterium]
MADAEPARPEFVREELDDPAAVVVEKPLALWERLYADGRLRKLAILAALALIWQLYAMRLDNPLLLPSFAATASALYQAVLSGGLLARAALSLKVLLMGYAAGLALAMLLSALAVSSRIGSDLLETLTAMFNPLPSIALLPIALLWFGLGNGSTIFVLIHAVLWPVALNTHAGFTAVSTTLRMVGRNYGLGGARYIGQILIPAAFPSILSGLKIGWAFAWRTLIAAELIFGVTSGSGGLGWFIFERKNDLDIPAVFAGLVSVILIGLVVENGIFRKLEAVTVRRWGMQQ